MDNIETIDYEFDTSFLIAYEAQLRNYEIFYYNPNDLIIDILKSLSTAFSLLMANSMALSRKGNTNHRT